MSDYTTTEYRQAGGQESFFLGSGRGCITSTPKTADFREKPRKCPKYERDSCMPRRKNGERPYPRAPKSQFSDPGFGLFSVFAWHSQPRLLRFSSPAVIFVGLIFSFNIISSSITFPGKGAYTKLYLYESILQHNTKDRTIG